MKSLRTLAVGLLSVAIIGMSAHLATAQNKDKPKGKDPASGNEAKATKHDDHAKKGKDQSETKQTTYLGVTVSPLHEGIFAHFRDDIEHRQGLMVQDVAAGSPAEKAGLKPKDILMTYGDQKLYSTSQLFALVREAKPDSKVMLGYKRDSKMQDTTATLAQHAMPVARMSDKSSKGKGDSTAAKKDQSQWESFDSLTINSLGDNRYQAQVSYLDKLGKVESLKFEGTRDEIRQDITSRSDLPQNERGHLLRALNMSSERIEFDAPRVFRTDDGRVIWEFSEPVFPF
ncbi:PDZ domain-containing protein [Bremerella cremea]|uniref:PDZ domain-containing protein n=1 Tax=Bremerella cremea TaxID=1031537 RepID=A0A368KUI3_9BACT|nr:PDZ domain-containing protein [Bremerella cremea]RCS53991.1 PDZ domain-containing protein [Bremerella cremea]